MPEAEEPPVEAQLSLFDAERVATGADVPALPPLEPVAAAAGRAGPPALVLGARAVRALPVPLLRRAARAACGRWTGADAVAGRSGWRRARSATPSTACSSGSTWPHRRRRRSTRCWAGIRPRPPRSWSGSAGSSRRTARRRWPRGWPRSSGVSSERPFAFEHDGVLFHGVLDVLHLEAAARSSPTSSRTCSATTRRPRSSRPSTGCSGSCTRSPASGPAPTRSRSSTSSSSGPTSWSRRRSGARSSPSSRPSSRGDRADPGRAFPPRPSEFACAGCPALDVVCAGPALGGP